MSQKQNWHPSIIFIALLFCSLTGLKTVAKPLDTSRIILAQTSSNLCRKVNTEQGLAVRTQPDSNSPRIDGVDPNQQVILAEGFSKILDSRNRLWVEIVSPIAGYVALGYPNNENNLIPCTETVVDQPENSASEIAMINLCRRVASEVGNQGLAIHTDASRSSNIRGGLPSGGRVMLVPNYQLIPDINGESRNWLQIMKPIAGFIAADTLIMCDDVGRSLPENTLISASATPAATNLTSNSTQAIDSPELCRRVQSPFAPDGLAIRADTSSSAAYLGGVEPGETVYLVPNYQPIPDSNDSSRSWLKITAPIPGFIAAGNVIMCP